VLVVAITCASCSTADSTGTASRATRVHTTKTTGGGTTMTGSTTPTPTTITAVPVFGARTMTVSGVSLSDGSWLTVGLHPTTAPVELQATGGTRLEVCPAGLDGGLNDSSWPPWFKFPSCVTFDPSSVAILPVTDGITHVAFAIKAISPSVSSAVSLTVTYSATDSFVEVIPPTTTSQTNMTVSYTPLSATMGATVTPVNLITPAPGYSLHVVQTGRPITQMAPCDFPTEISSCFGGVTPGQQLAVQLVGDGGPVVLNLGWE
jgi:hypothetical protein